MIEALLAPITEWTINKGLNKITDAGKAQNTKKVIRQAIKRVRRKYTLFV